jgi:hypothetical protein
MPFAATRVSTSCNTETTVLSVTPALTSRAFWALMKHYLHSNDPLFDPVTLGYVLYRGTIRERNKQLRRQGLKSLMQKIRTGKSHFV